MKCVRCTSERDESDFYYRCFQLDWCISCRKQFPEAWFKYRTNLASKRYAQRHPEKIKEKNRKNIQLHPKVKKERNNQFRQEHPDYMHNWNKQHPGYYQQRRKENEIGFTI